MTNLYENVTNLYENVTNLYENVRGMKTYVDKNGGELKYDDEDIKSMYKITGLFAKEPNERDHILQMRPIIRMKMEVS